MCAIQYSPLHQPQGYFSSTAISRNAVVSSVATVNFWLSISRLGPRPECPDTSAQVFKQTCEPSRSVKSREHRPQLFSVSRCQSQYFKHPPTKEAEPSNHYHDDQYDQQSDHNPSGRPHGRRPGLDLRIVQVDGSQIVHSFVT